MHKLLRNRYEVPEVLQIIKHLFTILTTLKTRGETVICSSTNKPKSTCTSYDLLVLVEKIAGVPFTAKSCSCCFNTLLQHFYAEPRAAKEILGWSSATNLPVDLKERFDEYVKIGRDKKEIKFDLDDKILEALKVPVAV